MLHRLSWARFGLLGFASLHCGTPVPTMGAGEDPGASFGTMFVPNVDVGDPRAAVGGQTGDDSGSIALACDVVTVTRLGLDEASALGASANELLPLALGSHTLPMRWLAPVRDADGSLLDYETRATSDVQVGVELVGSEARQLERFDSVYAVSCPTLLEVDVRLTLASADGALAEQVDGTLVSGFNPGMVGVSVTIPPSALGGSFTFDPPELEGQLPTGLTLSVGFTRYGQSGEVTQIYGEGAGARRLTRAQWPVWEECGFWGWVPAVYEAVRPSATDLVEAVRAMTPLTLLNARGERAPLELGLTLVPQSACFTPAQAPMDALGTTASWDVLSVSTQVSLNSSALPAPLQVPLELVGYLRPDTGELNRGAFSTAVHPCGTNSYYSAQEFVTHCGDWGVDLGGVQSVFLEVSESSLTAEGGYTVFRIRGMKASGCTPSPNGFSCSGGDTSGILEAVTLGEVRILEE
jgi:hypothetical protein